MMTKREDEFTKLDLKEVGYYRLEGKCLGKGTFARVELAIHKLLGVKVAIKIVNTEDLQREYVRKNFEREGRVLSLLNHPNIVRLYETMKTSSHYCLVMEYINGDSLLHTIRSSPEGILPEPTARWIIQQLVEAIKHVHLNKILHRDLKPENILLFKDKKHLKLIDFGLSNFYDPSVPFKTHCGSLEYAAPELFNPKGSYGPEVDMWSLGVILYRMVVGSTPFVYQRDKSIPSDERKKKLASTVSKGLTKENEDAMNHLSEACKDLIKGLLQPDSSKRTGLQKLCYHPWVIGGPDETLRFPSAHSAYYVYAKNLTLSRLSQILNISKEELSKRMMKSNYDSLTAMYYLVLDYIIDGDHAVGIRYSNDASLSPILSEAKESKGKKNAQEEELAKNAESRKQKTRVQLTEELSTPVKTPSSLLSFENLNTLQNGTNSEVKKRREIEEKYMKELEAELEYDLENSDDSVDLTGIWNFEQLEDHSGKENDDTNMPVTVKGMQDTNICSEDRIRNGNIVNGIRNEGTNTISDGDDYHGGLPLGGAKQHCMDGSLEEVVHVSAIQDETMNETCDRSTSMIIDHNMMPLKDNSTNNQPVAKMQSPQVEVGCSEKACQADIVGGLGITDIFIPLDSMCIEERPVVSVHKGLLSNETQKTAYNNTVPMPKEACQEPGEIPNLTAAPSFRTPILVTLPQIGDGPSSSVNEGMADTRSSGETEHATVAEHQQIPLPPPSCETHINHQLQTKRHMNNREHFLKISTYDIKGQAHQLLRQPSSVRTLQAPRQVLSVPICNPTIDTKESSRENIQAEKRIVHSETAKKILIRTPSVVQDNLRTTTSKLSIGRGSKEVIFTDRPSNIRPLKGLNVSESTEGVQTQSQGKNTMFPLARLRTSSVSVEKPGIKRKQRSKQERIFLKHTSLGILPKDSRFLALNDVKDAAKTSLDNLLQTKPSKKVNDATQPAILDERPLSALKPENVFKRGNLKKAKGFVRKKETKWDQKLYEGTILSPDAQSKRNDKLTSFPLSKNNGSLKSTFPERNERNQIVD